MNGPLYSRDKSRTVSEDMSGNEKDKELDISDLDVNGIFSPRIVSHRQFRSGPSNEYSLSKRLVGNQHRKMKKAKHRSQTGFTSRLRARNMASPRFKQASSKNIQNVEFRCNVRKLALGKKVIPSGNVGRRKGVNRIQEFHHSHFSKQKDEMSSESKPVSKEILFRKHNIFTRQRHSQHQEYMSSATNDMSLIPMLQRLGSKDIERWINVDLSEEGNQHLKGGPLEIMSKVASSRLTDNPFFERDKTNAIRLPVGFKVMEFTNFEDIVYVDEATEKILLKDRTSIHRNEILVPKTNRLSTTDICIENHFSNLDSQRPSNKVFLRSLCPKLTPLQWLSVQVHRTQDLSRKPAIDIKKLHSRKILQYISSYSTSKSCSEVLQCKNSTPINNEDTDCEKNDGTVEELEISSTNTNGPANVARSCSKENKRSEGCVSNTNNNAILIQEPKNDDCSERNTDIGDDESNVGQDAIICENPKIYETSCSNGQKNSEDHASNIEINSIINDGPNADEANSHRSSRKKRKLDEDDVDNLIDPTSFCEVQLKADEDISEEDLKKIEDDLAEFHTQQTAQDHQNTKTPDIERENDHELISAQNNLIKTAVRRVQNGNVISPTILKRLEPALAKNTDSKLPAKKRFLLKVKSTEKLYPSGTTIMSPDLSVSRNITRHKIPLQATPRPSNLNSSHSPPSKSPKNKNTNIISSQNIAGLANRVILIPRPGFHSRPNLIPQMIPTSQSSNINERVHQQLVYAPSQNQARILPVKYPTGVGLANPTSFSNTVFSRNSNATLTTSSNLNRTVINNPNDNMAFTQTHGFSNQINWVYDGCQITSQNPTSGQKTIYIINKNNISQS